MKSITALVLLILSFKIVTAQQMLIDSLKKELSTAKSDTNRVLLLAELTKAYYLFKPDTAIMLGQQAYNLSESLHYIRGEALSLNRIASAYSTLGDYAKSLTLFTKALAISRELNDSIGITQAYNNIGDTYLTQKDYTKALSYFKKANGAITPALKPYPRMIYLLNIGECYLRMKQYDSAKFYLQNTYKKVKELQFNDLYGDFERDLGELEAAKNNQDTALDHFRKSVKYYEEIEDQQHLSMVYYTMADAYHRQGLKDSSILFAKKALSTAQAGSYNQGILDASKKLSDYYAESDAAEAFRYLKLATAAKDSLFSQEKVKQLLSISFEEKQREREIEAARTESRNQVKVFALLGILAAFLLLAIILYRNNWQKQKANSLLKQQKQKIENTLSELKVTQAQLIQSEKMASLGELTAGIAHEIQNPLNFVNNFSEVSIELAQELKEEINKTQLPAEEKETIETLVNDIVQNQEKINYHGQRADAIVKGMLQHSRASTGKKEPTDINALVDEYLRLSYHGLRAKNKSFNSNMKAEYDTTLSKINIIPQDVGRVILNIFNNAFYSVAEKRKLKDNTYEPTVWVRTKNEGDKVIIVIRDNGTGIPKKVLDKIYQPFFSTKPTGGGTGLGLSISYDIITKVHKGQIHVETKEGEFAEFIITIPYN
ncbi:tetratricopeptide repeat-containing sensor histidine kinase [Segetibacter koreensis]|uniref:tetratricopeptide repeat-containing sensor histidine kinase n=1 Tax=Segetibacter koreensis TaxID=398037 RepID=UPI000380D8B0|nr:tetratricopeptide repeat protein [Segetibacter koreensis]